MSQLLILEIELFDSKLVSEWVSTTRGLQNNDWDNDDDEDRYKQSCVMAEFYYTVSNGPIHWVAISMINTLSSGQDGRHFPNDIFTCIFLNENV